MLFLLSFYLTSMRQKGFRHNITQSLAILPLVGLLAAVVWMLPDVRSLQLGGGLLVTFVMAYLVIECNNRYQLLRVRSRMNSVVFLALMAAFPGSHLLGWHLAPAAALLAAYFVLFRVYGQTRTQGTLFHVTLLLSLGCLVFPPLVLVIPFALFVAAVQLRALRPAAFGAAVLGWLLPYWIYAAILLALHGFDWTLLLAYYADVLPQLPKFDYVAVNPLTWVSYAAVIVPGLIGTAHFYSTSYNDKIRTRQFLYSLTVLQIPVLLLTALYPEQSSTLLPLLVAVYAPMISHHLTLARGRMADFWFVCCTLAVAALIAFPFFSF